MGTDRVLKVLTKYAVEQASNPCIMSVRISSVNLAKVNLYVHRLAGGDDM